MSIQVKINLSSDQTAYKPMFCNSNILVVIVDLPLNLLDISQLSVCICQ